MCQTKYCIHCGEVVLTSEDTYVYANGPVAHRACALRQVIGSVAHLEQRCSCYVVGASEGDPEGMSRREAAQAAMRLWYAQRGGSARDRAGDDQAAPPRGPCAHCGRTRTLHPYQGALWCGTCISREERRINTREMHGRGRRGY